MEIKEIIDKGLNEGFGQRDKIQGKGFLVSFAFGGSGPTGTETALIKGKNYYILNGNWLEEYRPLVKKGYKACKEFFDSQKDEHINFWSN